MGLSLLVKDAEYIKEKSEIMVTYNEKSQFSFLPERP